MTYNRLTTTLLPQMLTVLYHQDYKFPLPVPAEAEEERGGAWNLPCALH